jgi:SAM-dependent methyltransferase
MQTALRFPFPKRLQRHESNEFPVLARRFTPRTVFMDIGSADCQLALQAASYVERVYAIDVSGRFLQSVLVPLNLRLVLCGGVRIPVPEASVDVAFSGGFVDQLHPEDAAKHLASVRRSLAPRGEYICRTASPSAVRRRMLAAGFSKVRVLWPFISFGRGNLLRLSATR